MRACSQESLRHFFAGLTEHAFVSRLGVADPPLIDYVAEMLARFVRADVVYRIRDLAGRRLEEVACMLIEAEERIGEARREVHRHVGDYTLFWTGLYPEALPKLQAPHRRDFLLDYCAQGKRAYYIASTIPAGDGGAQSDVLRRLSHDFETCVQGLGEVRRQWERQVESP
ncbi:MAG: hypothetical protein GTO53_01750 [Planctomycetales bacterium]|nr:hypothetical protein [Planctomycetales bacterium]NIM07896.1 hypothetical protein [Planctomycetales bacterium]NIN07383.1 hypothetical protein [Planctomycetales bacterium]NIN76487.1 hypothetical protein [Planctomycetales bacterium]NIO33677.1 hypothetical protein [Planctomycetales bacterium]